MFLPTNLLADTDLVPHDLTSNTSHSPYVVSASSVYSTFAAWKAFDGISDYWVAGAAPAQLEIDLGVGNAQIVGSYTITPRQDAPNRSPKVFTLEGSNDEITWNTVSSPVAQTGWTTADRSFTCTSISTEYRYWRLNVTSNEASTSFIAVAELYLYLQPPASTYTLTGYAGGTNGEVSRNFSVQPDAAWTGTITPSDGGDGGTFNPASLTWSGTNDAQTFTYTPASTGEKTISTTNNGTLTNPSALAYYSTTPYTILPSDLWENAYSTDQTNYYLSSPFARLVAETDATGFKFTTWNTGTLSSLYAVAYVVDGAATPLAATVATGENTFYVNGLDAGTKTIEIVASTQYKDSPNTGNFLKTVEWFGANTSLTMPSTTNRIIIYGDSILSGYGTTNPPTDNVGILVRDSTNRSVLHEAYASRELKDDCTSTNVNQSLIDNLTLGSPTHIWLGIGVNDYGHNQWNATNFGLAYADLLDKLHTASPNTKIIAQTPITQGTETANSFGNTLDDYRNQIITLVGSRSWVTLVSGPSLLTYPTDYQDTQHPNTAGNVIYANGMLPYITIYTITASAGAHGSISPSGSVSANYGDTKSFTITPDTGYHVFDVLADSVSVGAVESYSFTNVTASHTISATFTINTHTLTYTAGANGSITGTSPQTVDYGDSGSAVTAVASSGYEFVDWSDDSTDNPRTDTNVTGNVSVTANFQATAPITSSGGGGGGLLWFDITVSAGENGKITPDSSLFLHGSYPTFTITPDNGYQITDVLVDNVSIGIKSNYTFNYLNQPHSISATFSKIETPAEQSTVEDMTPEQKQAKIQELIALINNLKQQIAQMQNMPSVVSAVFETPLYKGLRSEDVRRLQALLATKPEIYPEGLVTGYFGPLTEKAVQIFQLNYGVVSSESDPGFGYVGPKTRAKLKEVFGN